MNELIKHNKLEIENRFFYKVVISFLMITLVLLCLILSDQEDRMVFALIPIGYVIGFIFILDIYRHANTPAMLVVNILYFVRYYLLPVLTLFDERTGYLTQNYNGIILLLFEEVAVIIAFALFLPAYIRKKKQYIEVKSSDRLKFSKQLYLAAVAVLLLTVFFIVIDRNVLKEFNIIFSFKGDFDALDVKDSGALTISIMIINLARIIVPAAVSLFFAERYIKKGNELNYYLSVFTGLILVMLIIEGVDRGTVLLQGLAIVFFNCFIMPKKAKKTMMLSLALLFVLGVYLMTARMFEDGSSGGMSKIVDYIQSYVAGIKNQTIVWDTYRKYVTSVNYLTILNDIFANVPILSGLTVEANTCLKFFNITYGRIGIDQVMPLMGNGILYFGMIFAPVFNILMIKVLLITDTAYVKSKNSMTALCTTYMASIMGFIHYQNVQLIMLYLSCRILPLFLICFVFSKIKIKELE